METQEQPGPVLTIEPIGYVRSALATKTEAVRQPRAGGNASGRIELLPGRNFEHALLDLDGWDYIWVLFWFHHNAGWRPKVLPPRSRSGRKGVFATRSPHRPNPIGISAVKLERIEGLTLHVADIDILDGTPVLDIKPYLSNVPPQDLRRGWLAEAEAARAQAHWDGVYTTKSSTAVSWYAPHLDDSLAAITAMSAPDARVIDVGGGASTLVDDLLSRGYRHLTVLDVSSAALGIAQ